MPWVGPDDTSLVTDLYELTMAASYFAHGMNSEATFDLFVRRLPPERNFLIACGLDDALDMLEAFRFPPESIAYLRSLGLFSGDFLEYLSKLRFRGSVRAIAEGEAVFADEPLLSVTAPLIEAQLVETCLLNCMTFQTMIASKAARVRLACGGRGFVDFGARRMHGIDAALRAPRAAYIAGAAATSSAVAGRMYGIPVSGTMAHSYVQAFALEDDAFRTYAGDFPGHVTLLLDTYDTVAAAHKVVQIVRERGEGSVQAVRLDSGDLDDLSRRVRAVLDEGGCGSVRIFASGDLNEQRIQRLVDAGAPIDAFGVGTDLGTSSDAPSVSGVYKLVEYEGRPTLKLAPGKQTLPGRKQVFRTLDTGRYKRDVLALEHESIDGARPLLEPVMQDGRRLGPRRPLDELRNRCSRTLSELPQRLLSLTPTDEPYEVTVSDALASLATAGRVGKAAPA